MLKIDYNSFDFSSVKKNATFYFEHDDKGHKLNAFMSSKECNDKLVVFLQGAIDREKLSPPIYHRWSWHKEIDSNVLCINDPLLNKNDDLRIGWYAGTKNFEYIRKYSKLILKIIDDLSIDRNKLMFYGSSAGGFAAIQFGVAIRNSTVVVNNPQTCILDYYETHVDDYLKVAFPDNSKEDVRKLFGKRLDLKELIANSTHIPDIHYYQNLADSFHYKNHFIPFISRVFECGKASSLKIEIYRDDTEGHSPLSRSKSITIINDFFKSLE